MAAGQDQRGPLLVNRSEHKRIGDAVRRSENGYSPGRYRGRVALWNPGSARAKVTTAIPTGTFDVPSDTGRAQIYHKDRTGAYVASGAPVVVHNQHTLSSSVPVGDPIFLTWADGDWWLIVADCPA